MMTSRRLPCATALLLALCLAAAASPAAYATTPEQEAVLATSQRSMNNPDGVFTVPEARTSLELFHPATWRAARLVLENTVEQFRTGHADPEAVRRILAYAPIVRDEELPTAALWDDTLQYVLENGIRNIYIVLHETDRPGVYQLLTIYSNRDGRVRWVPQDIEYDAASGWIYGTGGDGVLGIGYEYNVRQYMSRSVPGTWQRALGYNRAYDLFAPLLSIYFDTLRFPFSYDGRDWMIQLWKGIYMPSNGAEIGLYEKDPKQPFFWDASDTLLDISMKMYQGETLFFDYGTQRTWWAGGFRYGNFLLTPLLPPSKLRLTGTITFEDSGMRDAFWASFEANRNAAITGKMEGMVFSFDWAAG